MPVHVDTRYLKDFMFLRNIHFTKPGFELLLGLLGAKLAHMDGRGGVLSLAIQLQAALNYMVGAMFQRSTGLCFNGSQSKARECLINVVEALLSMKGLCACPH